MPATVLVGAQFGSEGKGKVAAYLARRVGHAVRTGGPNAGHTIVENGQTLVVRQLPSAVVQPDVKLYLGAGAIIDLDVIQRELRDNAITPARLRIDRQAVIISQSHPISELELVRSIGSTGKGVGAAVAAKIWRGPDVQLARDFEILEPYCDDVAAHLHRALELGESIMIEGTQGTGLSLHHGNFPFVTSRDVTAGSLCGEAGIGPTAVEHVILVVRTYPIRVAGPSGPLAGEMSWDDVTARSGYPTPIREYTTVTKKLRRVGTFSMDAVFRAVKLNGASEIAITFADYIEASARDVRDESLLPSSVRKFVERLEDATLTPVRLISTGPDTDSIIERRS